MDSFDKPNKDLEGLLGLLKNLKRRFKLMKSKLTEQDLVDNVLSLIDEDDEVIILYSGISSFAHKFGADAKYTANMILDVFQDVCGNKRTLVLPSYSMEFSKNKILEESHLKAYHENIIKQYTSTENRPPDHDYAENKAFIESHFDKKTQGAI